MSAETEIRRSRSGEELDLAPLLGTPVWTIPAMLRARAEFSPSVNALWSQDSAGKWRALSWAEFHRRASIIAAALRRRGLCEGDRVGIVARSSPNWDVVQLGILAAGGVVVGLDLHDGGERIGGIVTRHGLVGLIVQDQGAVERLGAAVCAGLRFLISVDPIAGPGHSTVDEIVAAADGQDAQALPPVEPDSPATVIFTSGTTGEAKGIQYTHRQVVLAAASMLRVFADIEQGSRMACWLPLSNLFQRMLNTCAIARGAQIFYVEQPQEIMKHVASIGPHLFIGVPRFYEKLHAGVVDRIDGAPALTRHLARWALGVGMRFHAAVRAGNKPDFPTRLQHALADRIVLRRIRGIMGANLRYMISGSAPMPIWLLERFQALGWLVLEAYGLSENIIPVAANRPTAYRFGTVGHAMPGSEVRLADDGELWVRGPGVCKRYLGEADWQPIVDADGFLATGDFASIDGDGFITLTGRKSDIFKTSTGRRIAPAGVEASLRSIPYVEHAVLIGEAHPFPVALLAVSEARLRAHAGAAADAPFIQFGGRIFRDVANSVAGLPDFQRPAGVVATLRTFTIESGELTPNLKLRRPRIVEAFAGELDELYRSIESGRSELVWHALGDGRTVLCRA